MESKFRKGDKVRYIGDGEFEEFLFSCEKGDEFIVDEADDKHVAVYLSNCQIFYNEDLELVSHPNDDRKTAFLQELKALLTKYNAEIDAYGGKNGDYGMRFNLGDFDIWYTHDSLDGTDFSFPITPENIFDYDKD